MKYLTIILCVLSVNCFAQCDVPPRFNPYNGFDNWALPCFTGKVDTVKNVRRKEQRYCTGQGLTSPPTNFYAFRWVSVEIIQAPPVIKSAIINEDASVEYDSTTSKYVIIDRFGNILSDSYAPIYAPSDTVPDRFGLRSIQDKKFKRQRDSLLKQH